MVTHYFSIIFALFSHSPAPESETQTDQTIQRRIFFAFISHYFRIYFAFISHFARQEPTAGGYPPAAVDGAGFWTRPRITYDLALEGLKF